MTTRLIALFALATIAISGQSQNTFDFEHLKCQGPVPKDFTQVIGLQVAQEIEKVRNENSDKRKTRKAKEEFITSSSYLLDELLMSGQVLFGDEVSKYLNDVADVVLKDDPQLRSELRFYAVKSNLANAFCTNQGMIFVTLGLIAQMEDEAQLAFVLAHEISHYTEEHTIESYVNQKATESDNKYRKNEEEMVKELSRYSKAAETEADSLGFLRFSRSDYALNSASTSFDVLQFAHLPYDEQAFDFTSLENQNFSIPEKLHLDSITAIDFDDDYDDPESSHPSIGARRKAMGRMIAGQDSEGGQKYVVGEERFKNIREICRYEGLRFNLRNQEYIELVHSANMLLDKHEGDAYLVKQRLKGLYLLSKYKSNGKELAVTHEEQQGEISAAYYLFEELNADQLLYITLANFQAMRPLVSEFDMLEAMEEDLMSVLIDDTDGKLDSLAARVDYIQATLATPPVEDESSEEEQEEDEALSKYEKLAKIRTDDSGEVSDYRFSPTDKMLLALSDWVKDPSVIRNWKNHVKEEKKRVKEEERERKRYNAMTNSQKRKHDKAEYKQSLKNEGCLGTKKVAFVDPQYYIVKEGKGIAYGASEGKEYDLYSRIKLVCGEASLQTEVITPKTAENQRAEDFNDLATFKDWYSEHSLHEDLDMEDRVLFAEQEYMNALADRVGTDHFALTGVIMFRQKEKYKGVQIAYGLLLYPVLPFVIYDVATPDYDTYLYNAVFDVRAGSLVIESGYHINSKANKGNINQMLYDSVHKAKQKPAQ